jgi:hypothetical protein
MTIRRPVSAGTLLGMNDFAMFERLALALAAGILMKEAVSLESVPSV